MRHNLAVERVMNDDGTMNEVCGKYAGMTAMECRKGHCGGFEGARPAGQDRALYP